MQALGVGKISAEIVIIVDTSYSMDSRRYNLYGTVAKLVPALITTLAKQEPQDLVAVITLGTQAKTQVVVEPGRPSSDTWVPPPVPNSGTSDFGLALQEAVGLFSHPPQDMAPQVGDVLLLSDGQVVDTPDDDPTYGGVAPAVFANRGWRDLQRAARNLPMPVTGFEMPLTSDKALQASQYAALRLVFPRVTQLQYARNLATDPTPAIQEIQASTTGGIQDGKIAAAVAHDRDAGLRVTWGGLPGARSKPLDLGDSGHADITVTVQALTRRVPLCVSGISITSTGLPTTIRADNLPASASFTPGEPPTAWHVRLTWQKGCGGATKFGHRRTMTGHLLLSAKVSSPYNSTIIPVDATFTYGGFHEGTSPQFTAVAPTASILFFVLAILGIVIVASVVMFGVHRAWLRGELTVVPVGGPPVWLPGEVTDARADGPPVRLRGLRVSRQVGEVPGKKTRIIVRGSPYRRAMRIRSESETDGQRWSRAKMWLPVGGKIENLPGVSVKHEPRARRKDRPRRRPR
jgi:hypothetical protein